MKGGDDGDVAADPQEASTFVWKDEPHLFDVVDLVFVVVCREACLLATRELLLLRCCHPRGRCLSQLNRFFVRSCLLW